MHPAQATYARWLGACTWAGLALLVAAFALYVLGVLAPALPIEDLPRLWSLPAERVAPAQGWGWLALLPRADMLVLAVIAWLSGCSVLCLLAALREFRRAGAALLATICLLEVVVLVLAASGALPH